MGFKTTKYFRQRRADKSTRSDKVVTNDFYINIENGCGKIQGLDPSTAHEVALQIVHTKPCVSAIALGMFFNRVQKIFV